MSRADNHTMEWNKDSFVVSDDFNKLDLEVIYNFLSNSYWGKGRSKELVADSIHSSFSLGLYFQDKHANKQIGFVRVISDYCTFAYICDVFVLPEYQKQKLGQFLMSCLFEHPKLTRVHWLLKTKDAQAFYRNFNFKEIDSSVSWMVRK